MPELLVDSTDHAAAQRILAQIGQAASTEVIRDPFESGLARIVERGQIHFVHHGLGRAIFGAGARTRRGRGEKKIIAVRKPKDRGGSLESGLSIRGIAAMQEEGGTRTKAHVIGRRVSKTALRALWKRNKVSGLNMSYLAVRGLAAKQAGKMLAFQGRKGPVFATAVQHPGGRVPHHPFLAPAITAEAPRINDAIATAVDRRIERVIQGAA
jgi:hypothetical protein